MFLAPHSTFRVLLRQAQIANLFCRAMKVLSKAFNRPLSPKRVKEEEE